MQGSHDQIAEHVVTSLADYGVTQALGSPGVCLGTVGKGALRLLNGLCDAAKSGVPLLAICRQVLREDIGTDLFHWATPRPEEVAQSALMMVDEPLVMREHASESSPMRLNADVQHR